MTIEVKPDIFFTPRTQEEADNANKLYAFVKCEKDKSHKDFERRSGTKVKPKRYTSNKFLKGILKSALDDVDGGQ
ncbi:hypothetical protein AB4648_08320 [Vibrio splendidus]